MNISAVFLDRDGVIIGDIGYLNDPKHVRLLPGVSGAIKSLNEHHVPVFSVSNQSGVARGMYKEQAIPLVHMEIERQLAKDGATIDGWYWCPHLPQGIVPEYAIECECRKPKPGMLLQAAKEHSLDLSCAWMIGDKEIDVATGGAVGAKPHSSKQEQKLSIPNPRRHLPHPRSRKPSRKSFRNRKKHQSLLVLSQWSG